MRIHQYIFLKITTFAHYQSLAKIMHSGQTDNKNSAFSKPLRFENNGISFTGKSPVIMGILNVTPDSFFDGGRYPDEESLIQQTKKMLADGADLVDIGAVSTRPGAKIPDSNSETDRLLPVIRLLKNEIPGIRISVDTFHTSVAEKMISEGVLMINDISGGTFDDKMADFIGENDIPYVLMHIHDRPETMQRNPIGIKDLQSVIQFIENQIRIFTSKGANQLITDPGFGFGKTVGLNYHLLSHLSYFKDLGYPVLVGISRKSMINKILNNSPNEALNGTTVLNTLALTQGADILRVHDVKEAHEARSLWQQFVQPAD
jgi:dihydropteroate synthase